MITAAQFVARFPEFGDGRAPTTLIEAAITDADAQLSPEADGVWVRDLRDQGLLYLTAHLLSTSPFGQQARLVTDEAASTYLKTFERLSLGTQVGFGRSTTDCTTL